MKVFNRRSALLLGMALLVVGVSRDAAAQSGGPRGNDSADWCVVSGETCTGKDKTLSVAQGESGSFTGRLISPDKLNSDSNPFPLNAYLAAGEWSSDCGDLACGLNPTVTITPSTLTFNDFAQGRDFSVQVFAGPNVVPGEYSVKIKTFGPDNQHLNGLGWGFGSGISLTILVTPAGECALPTLTIVSPTEGASFSICQVSGGVGTTPIDVSLEASSGITDFSASISKSDGSNPSAVSLVKNLGVDPATATGTGSAIGTIGGYKLTATATNACGTTERIRLFSLNYVFEWLPPTPSSPNENQSLATKFAIRDCSGAFVSDPTVEVLLLSANGTTLDTRSYGSNPSTAVTINTDDEVYHTNLTLPSGQNVTYSIIVKFQGIQQGPARTFTTKKTGPPSK